MVALHAGEIRDVRASDGVLSYVRVSGDDRVQVHLNLTHEVRWVESVPGMLLVTSMLDRGSVAMGGWVELRGDEAIIIEGLR